MSFTLTWILIGTNLQENTAGKVGADLGEYGFSVAR